MYTQFNPYFPSFSGLGASHAPPGILGKGSIAGSSTLGQSFGYVFEEPPYVRELKAMRTFPFITGRNSVRIASGTRRTRDAAGNANGTRRESFLWSVAPYGPTLPLYGVGEAAPNPSAQATDLPETGGVVAYTEGDAQRAAAFTAGSMAGAMLAIPAFVIGAALGIGLGIYVEQTKAFR